MRTVYLGTSDFAATVLERLAASPHAPTLVVTPPDSRQGRGRKVSPPPVAELARERGMELLQAASVNEEGALERIRAAEPEAILVCAFGQLIKEPLLSLTEFLNVHPSLLPRHRGIAAVEWTIKEGDAIAGGTIYHLSERLDAGAIAAQDWVFVKKGETARELWERALAPLGLRLLAQVIDQAKTSGILPSMPQDEQFATNAPRLDNEKPHAAPKSAAS